MEPVNMQSVHEAAVGVTGLCCGDICHHRAGRNMFLCAFCLRYYLRIFFSAECQAKYNCVLAV